MQPNPTHLIERMGITTPLVGFYDSPDPSPFAPLLKPGQGERQCTFAFYKLWTKGKTLHITEKHFGCPGAKHWLCGVEAMPRDAFVKFLADDEGLRASHDLMNQWLDLQKPYQPEHSHILIGPLREEQYEYLKSVTFYANPDQLTQLVTGAYYNYVPGGPSPVIAPFGSGCMELVTLFEDLNVPQAIIGATDVAMRQFLPPDILAFTVTKPLFEQLCALDERSFLYKPFLKRLRKARGFADF